MATDVRNPCKPLCFGSIRGRTPHKPTDTAALSSDICCNRLCRFLSWVPAIFARRAGSHLAEPPLSIPEVIIEAMASGLPVIAPAVGGIPGAIQGGVQALLVPPGKSEALSSALTKVFEDATVYHTLSSEGLKLARNHSLEIERDRMLEIITPYLRNRKQSF